jgi:hypothetical protein
MYMYGMEGINMIRKQIYLEPHHDYLLKKQAQAAGTSEAELVRRALEAHLNAPMATGRNQKAWSAEKAFIEDRIKTGGKTGHPSTKGGRTWRRGDLYDR